MTENEQKTEMLHRLLFLRDSEKPNNRIGICRAVCGRETDWDLLEGLFRRWPRFSGIDCYPISDPSGLYDPKRAFTKYPSWSGPYGELRHELLDFLIEELQKELSEPRPDGWIQDKRPDKAVQKYLLFPGN